MSETSQEIGHQGSTGFQLVMKRVGTIHRALYRASDGKLGRTFFVPLFCS
jgi:hypothetical protein